MYNKFRTSAVILVCIAMIAGFFSGCGNSVKSETEPSLSTDISDASACSEQSLESAVSGQSVLPTEDRAGNPITVPGEISRIVSMSPSTTQVLIELGMSDKIVGIDTNSADFLEDLNPDVTQFDMMNPDNEAIAALEPDIVFASGMSSYGGTNSFQPLIDSGVCVVDIPTSASIDDIYSDLTFIGDCIGKDSEAKQLVINMQEAIDEVAEETASFDETKTVLFMMSIPTAEAPTIYTFGNGTYMSDMLDVIGADNVCEDQEGWLAISVEDAIAMNPDVIITNVNWVDDPVSEIENLEGWENVTAVANGAVYYVDANLCSRPNNHIADAVAEWENVVYPSDDSATTEQAS